MLLPPTDRAKLELPSLRAPPCPRQDTPPGVETLSRTSAGSLSLTPSLRPAQIRVPSTAKASYLPLQPDLHRASWPPQLGSLLLRRHCEAGGLPRHRLPACNCRLAGGIPHLLLAESQCGCQRKGGALPCSQCASSSSPSLLQAELEGAAATRKGADLCSALLPTRAGPCPSWGAHCSTASR